MPTKTIAEHWIEYLDSIPNIASSAQIAVIKHAFYAGNLAMLYIIKETSYEEITNDILRDTIVKEVTEYFELPEIVK